MKKIIFVIALACFAQASHAQTDEQLREQIRKEILEEQRLKEEQELLEYRKEKIRREEEERLQAEKDSLNEALTKKAKTKEVVVKPASSKQTKSWDEHNARRIDGWSISIHTGPNFALGDYAKRSGSRARYATTGYTLSIRNYIHFNKTIAVFIGLGYDGNELDKYSLIEESRAKYPTAGKINVSKSTPYHNYTIKAGPSIRKLGQGISLYFQPFIGLNILNASDHSVSVQDGTVLRTTAIDGKSSTMFLVGSSVEFCVQIGKTSDLVVGLETNIAFGSVGQDKREYYNFDETFSSSFEKINPIRIALVVGYRFHL